MTQRTRFVCLSDTHAYTPSEAGFKLPAGDVLIHAGDLTNHGSKSELRKTMNWIAAADFEVKIVICGNHDITLDAAFYAEHGSKFHGQHPEDHQECMEIVTTASPSIVLLRHQSALIRLTRPNGPNTVFKVFGSPFSQSPGTWAYGYESAHAAALWDQIPLDADLVVTHTPPHSLCDSRAVGAVGCKALRQALSRVRPLLAVCGHVHESRGFERVRWSQSSASSSISSNARPEASDNQDQVVKGELPVPGSKKQSLVDLTGRKAQRLDNHGCAMVKAKMPSSQDTLYPSCPMDDQPLPRPRAPGQKQHSPSSCPQSAKQTTPRPLRRETCIVNAAILATSWPHRGGKRFHAPIVVDLELPTWTKPPGPAPLQKSGPGEV
ncbi:metallophosphatase domain-containing protein [Aspergillus affinis]|uniref:metallophosphatase domain-containing protein n=1 Tax=Aspergillus affinis TaxID=1070780 RepID=UPI0022FEED3E|nr:Ser/Thr protein phosphatase family protein [Aspergillus affinis]KAI9045759.1 Ser/Thr protein phosphatase family protein [Aspergillus affinis]